LGLGRPHTVLVHDASDEELVRGLPAAVIGRLRAETADAARIIRCLRTAATLIDLADADEQDLRLAESAAYNLREALDSVVEGVDPAEGGLKAVLAAWRRLDHARAQASPDEQAARDELDAVLRKIAANEDRSSKRALQLLAYLEKRAGISPVSGRNDPVSEHSRLYQATSNALHASRDLMTVKSFYTQVVAWFVRMFTPPDETVESIRSLAAQPWRGPEQVAELERLATNGHHLYLFFSEVADPGWLAPLRAADVLKLPPVSGYWPGSGLLMGLGQSHPQHVGQLLRDLFRATKHIPKENRLVVRFELLRVASDLGPGGYDVVGDVVERHGGETGIRLLSTTVAKQADPADPVVYRVARAVLNDLQLYRDGDNYYATTLLNQLQAGLTETTIEQRGRMLAGKVRNLAEAPEASYILRGPSSLLAEPGDRLEPFLLLAHHLARLLVKARELGVSTVVQSSWLGDIPGEVGQRVHGVLLTGADDVPLADKIAHIAVRLRSKTPTGDDLALIDDILSAAPAPAELRPWADALGTPSPEPTEDDPAFPSDWRRAWRWSAVLPADVLTDWQDSIARVNTVLGTSDRARLTEPRPTMESGVVTSPYSAGQLAALPMGQAAALVASWQPADDFHGFVGPLELARALQEAVSADPVRWSEDPSAVVATLRDPIYVEHYFLALAEKAADILPHAAGVLTAVRRVLPDAGSASLAVPEEPTGLVSAILGVITAFANRDADLAADLDALWAWAVSVVDDVPDQDGGLLFDGRDALDSAINRTWGQGLEAVLALAAWEVRATGAARPAFEDVLDETITRAGSVGLEFRAILVRYLPQLEAIAGAWLESRTDQLFRAGEHAAATVDLTARWAQQTTWLYENLEQELFAAARRGADGAARKIVVAMINDLAGYDADTVINKLRGNVAALARVAEESAYLVQDAEADSPLLAKAQQFWARLLEADRKVVPGDALVTLGRWAFVGAVDDNTWVDLTMRTLNAAGRIDNVFSVADRAAELPPGAARHELLLRLLGAKEPWERQHVARKAIEVLRRSAGHTADDSLRRLRTRLIELGYHEAQAITFDPPSEK